MKYLKLRREDIYFTLNYTAEDKGNVNTRERQHKKI